MTELQNKTACVVGVGRLGSLTSESLAKLGVGRVILIDHDIVEEDNVLRQVSYNKEDVGKLKALAMQRILCQINTSVEIVAKPIHLDNSTAGEMKADLVFDCTDNFKARHVINKYCKEHSIPWVFSALSENKGQILVCAEGWEFDSTFGHASKGLTCEEELLHPAVDMVASTQVTQGIKLLSGEEYTKDLILCDSNDNSFDKIKIQRKEKVETTKEEKEFQYKLELCETRTRIKVIPNQNMDLDLASLKHDYTVIIDTPILLVIEIDGQRVLIHKFGELNFYETRDKDKVRNISQELYAYKH